MSLRLIGTVSAAASERAATTDALHATYLQAAIEAARAKIAKVPGSGPVRGVWSYGGTKYAFRDNASGTACDMHRETPSGWAHVDLGKTLDFTSGGTTEVVEGNTITGATTGATATVERVVVTSGSWAGGTAAGYFVVSGQVSIFGAENLNVGASLNVATVSGNSTAIILQPGGRYEFYNYNFRGASSQRRMYGCDGVNKGFEFDGTVYCPITTGMDDDAPIHVIAHKKHLFFAFRNGSNQHSSIGEPLEWQVITGAAEIGTGDEITGYAQVPGGLLAIFNRNSTYILYGDSAAGWELKTHADESGAAEWSVQQIGSPRYLDDRGMTSLNAVQDYGDFASATFSQKIQPLLDAKRREAAAVSASMRVKNKDQYRLFFDDGTGIITKFRQKSIEFTRINYGMVVRCACSAEEEDGTEVLLFGSDDGYVYELDAGTSFDGEPIEAYLRLPFGHLKTPQYIKKYNKVVLELDAPSSGCSIEFNQEYDYGNAGNPRGVTQTFDINSGGGYWGQSEWSGFVWGNQAVGTAEGYLNGSGKNMGIFLRSYATYETPHTINGINLHYSLRGRSR